MPSPMTLFKKILVGVDLADERRYVCGALSRSTEEAVRRARWIAGSTAAELCFFHVLPPTAERLSRDSQVFLAEDDEHATVFDHAKEVLAGLAASAAEHGIKTSSKVVFGKGWVEIIREVLRGDHDLVVVGTRKKGSFNRMLFGRTAIKLLRKCPCPVWATAPLSTKQLTSILVAHDLTAVGDAALGLGRWLASKQGASLHVLHAIERIGPNWADTLEEDKREVLGQLQRGGSTDVATRFHVDTDPPEQAILSYVEAHDIQLVIMGTLARTGIAGLIVGNTAEQLLPFLPCSVLAVKPEGFTSPVRLDDGAGDSA